MFGCLRKLLFGKPKTKREIFEYFDGSETRYADPLVIKRKLDEKGGEDWTKLFEVFSIPTTIGGAAIGGNLVKELTKKQAETQAQIITMVYHAFEVRPFSFIPDPNNPQGERKKRGLTELQTLELLANYIKWFSEAMGEILPLSTASKSSGLGVSGPNQLTSNSVASPSVHPLFENAG